MKRDTEKQTRARILELATRKGYFFEAKQLFDKYDNLLKTCKNQKEYDEIAALGAAEIYRMLNLQDGLVIGNKEILPATVETKSLIKV